MGSAAPPPASHEDDCESSSSSSQEPASSPQSTECSASHHSKGRGAVGRLQMWLDAAFDNSCATGAPTDLVMKVWGFLDTSEQDRAALARAVEYFHQEMRKHTSEGKFRSRLGAADNQRESPHPQWDTVTDTFLKVAELFALVQQKAADNLWLQEKRRSIRQLCRLSDGFGEGKLPLDMRRRAALGWRVCECAQKICEEG
mmetsp:Transcript_8820/g.19739  ORF Transcript_8820/g.19739 Transcript_8820/m.19739 type:complete len:200 (-) Transcript_8820:64-663(-)